MSVLKSGAVKTTSLSPYLQAENRAATGQFGGRKVTWEDYKGAMSARAKSSGRTIEAQYQSAFDSVLTSLEKRFIQKKKPSQREVNAFRELASQKLQEFKIERKGFGDVPTIEGVKGAKDLIKHWSRERDSDEGSSTTTTAGTTANSRTNKDRKKYERDSGEGSSTTTTMGTAKARTNKDRGSSAHPPPSRGVRKSPSLLSKTPTVPRITPLPIPKNAPIHTTTYVSPDNIDAMSRWTVECATNLDRLLEIEFPRGYGGSERAVLAAHWLRGLDQDQWKHAMNAFEDAAAYFEQTDKKEKATQCSDWGSAFRVAIVRLEMPFMHRQLIALEETEGVTERFSRWRDNERSLSGQDVGDEKINTYPVRHTETMAKYDLNMMPNAWIGPLFYSDFSTRDEYPSTYISRSSPETFACQETHKYCYMLTKKIPAGAADVQDLSEARKELARQWLKNLEATPLRWQAIGALETATRYFEGFPEKYLQEASDLCRDWAVAFNAAMKDL